jgi:hypothetical protein
MVEAGVRHLMTWSIAISALLHLILLIFVLALPAPSPIVVPQEDSVGVELVQLPSAHFTDNRKPLPPAPSSKTETTVPFDKEAPESQRPLDRQEAPLPDTAPKRVRPTNMLSEAVLADPRSAKAKAALTQLAPAEQVEQLCNLEAMAQVDHWDGSFQPDRVVAYAMADTKMQDNLFSAEGAVIHGKQNWYKLQFTCELTPDHTKVVAFEFLIGDPIPREVWSQYNLPEEDGAHD